MSLECSYIWYKYLTLHILYIFVSCIHIFVCVYIFLPKAQSSSLNGELKDYKSQTSGMTGSKLSSVHDSTIEITNSWYLYQNLHKIKTVGILAQTEKELPPLVQDLWTMDGFLGRASQFSLGICLLVLNAAQWVALHLGVYKQQKWSWWVGFFLRYRVGE